MHVTVLIRHLHQQLQTEYYIEKQGHKPLEQQFHSYLGTCKINYLLHGMKLKNDMFIDIIKQRCSYILHIFIPDKVFKFLNWNVKHFEAALSSSSRWRWQQQLHSKKPSLQVSSGIYSLIEKEKCVIFLHCRMPIAYTFIWVISTPTVQYNTTLVRYAHFI